MRFVSDCDCDLLWFAYMRTTWYSKSKTIPRHIFARKLFLKQIWTQHQKLEIGSTNPLCPPPPPGNGNLANLDSATKVGNWFPRTPPENGNFGFQQIWTQQQKLEIGFHENLPPPPPPPKWELWILANLDSATKVGNWFGF